jgi:hypothetical protein
MTDLTSGAPLRFKGEAKEEIFSLDTSGAQTIYKGQPMFIDQDVDTVYIRGFVGANTVAATDVFVGIAAEDKSVLASAAETTEIKVWTHPSIIGFKSTVFTVNSSLGAAVYMSDSGTLAATGTGDIQIGTLFKIEDGYCYVKLSSPQICAGA